MGHSERQKLEKMISQLNRRLADTTRAYEQEKKVCLLLCLHYKCCFFPNTIIVVGTNTSRPEDKALRIFRTGLFVLFIVLLFVYFITLQRNHLLEAEKQRTEDENKKLIEVIKSLSGTSF